MANLLSKRFQELSEQYRAVEAAKGFEWDGDENVPSVAPAVLLNWGTKVKHLLSLACGADSEHYSAFATMLSADINAYVRIGILKGLLDAAQEDYDGGYFTSTRMLVQAEVFSSELEQATELLAKGYQTAAAVIAGVVLETHLQELSRKHGVASGKTEAMNAELVKKGAYNVLRQKQITAHADLRNKAAHGKGSEFTHEDVKAMIADIERFLAE